VERAVREEEGEEDEEGKAEEEVVEEEEKSDEDDEKAGEVEERERENEEEVGYSRCKAVDSAMVSVLSVLLKGGGEKGETGKEGREDREQESMEEVKGDADSEAIEGMAEGRRDEEEEETMSFTSVNTAAGGEYMTRRDKETGIDRNREKKR